MPQSKCHHVAIIMDGNGRWAQRRGWPRARGHAAGAEALRRVVRAAVRARIPTLTLYAFSSDNWRRAPVEVEGLLHLLARYLDDERNQLTQAGVRCEIIGRRDRLPSELQHAIAASEAATRDGRNLRLRLAIDYSGRGEIARAAVAALARWAREVSPRSDLARRLIEARLEADCGPVDLLIRTGGERRLSDFLPWEVAYAELVFTRVPWPDFGSRQLRRALAEFARRERRFGVDPPAEVMEA